MEVYIIIHCEWNAHRYRHCEGGTTEAICLRLPSLRVECNGTKQSANRYRHCEGGTTEAICLIEGQIASTPTLISMLWFRNNVNNEQ